MADIKPDNIAEKPRLVNEKSLASSEISIEQAKRGVETEKLKNFEQARKQVIEEILHAETLPPTVAQPVGSVSLPQAQRQKQIENVLADGLKDIYRNLAPAKQKEFKKAGEETARKINLLLAKAKINIGEIIKLIKKWLSLIPGVNKYFLEQEAKIKADELIRLRNESK